MNEVLHVDFGKERNEYTSKLMHLLGVLEAHKAELRDNPEQLFRMAEDEIHRLRQGLREAAESLHRYIDFKSIDPAQSYQLPDIVRVDAAELKRLRACAEIVGRIQHESYAL